MKRFWKETTVEQVDGGWQVALDGRRIRTQGGAPQIVPTHALAQALADEVDYPMNYHVTGSIRLAHSRESFQKRFIPSGSGTASPR